MSGSSDSAECNSAGRTDSKSVFLAHPGLICSPFPIRLTINEHYATEIAYVQAVALFVCRFRLERGDEFFETRVTPKRIERRIEP